MNISYLEYSLEGGYIHNWLVASVQRQTDALFNPVEQQDKNRPQRIFDQFYDQDSNLLEMPVDRVKGRIGGFEFTWNYYRCHEDHFVDLSAECPVESYIRSWAYTRIKAAPAVQVTFFLTTLGPADVWLNGNHIYRQKNYSEDLQTVQFQVNLVEENELLVRFEQVAARNCENAMALRLSGFPPEKDAKNISVIIPTRAKYPNRQQKLERTFEKAYLEEVVNYRGAHFNLRWAEDMKEELRYAYQVQDDQERIYVEGTWGADPEKPLDVGHTFRLFERPYWVVLRAPGREYYEMDLRYQRKMPIYVLDNAYASKPSGTFPQRQLEALQAATRYENNLYAEIAKMALEKWEDIKSEPILMAIERVKQVEVDSDLWLLGLIGMLFRYQGQPSFPEGIQPEVEACILNFNYRSEDNTSVRPVVLNGHEGVSESSQLVMQTCELLAGQHYPDRIFAKSGRPGSWHQGQAEQAVLAWITSRGTKGFEDWDSNCYFERYLGALSHLASLAATQEVKELAAVLMDKIFFSIAVNSYQGVFGSTHGRTDPSMLKSAQLEATAGIARMMWGLGVYNRHILGTVSLACSDYEFPLLIGDIALDSTDEIWNTERQIVSPRSEGVDEPRDEVNKVTYKTPDYMLSSAQDYRPGEQGSGEHIWQATLGSEAVVFVNQPAWMNEHRAHRAGFWLGNATLPRVVQWKDVLIAIYQGAETDWLDFTHAYFPIYAFDEYAFIKNWAFARKGSGYLALTAANGFELIKRGPDGYRELRSYGKENIWLCQMGRAPLDGNFGEFKTKITALKPRWRGLSVAFRSLHGDRLSFGWEGPFQRNGNDQPITGFNNFNNPYCVSNFLAEEMDIHFDDTTMRINFKRD
jgi:hypothetical protein